MAAGISEIRMKSNLSSFVNVLHYSMIFAANKRNTHFIGRI
ncbi:hypothetical protein HMPREF9555_00208 [Selenomonas artemidis F0399]|uniref:Uncharacterized protein n=1 Tax=Selenomonas artemidis F0399 TaxID=749551 RepID=E7MZR5_9FIRM|nr:hypothetical protein HMPREF9555_00208 [Selenomonas artemidis F0399]